MRVGPAQIGSGPDHTGEATVVRLTVGQPTLRWNFDISHGPASTG